MADDRPALLPLTDAEGWTVDCRATGKTPLITLRPSAPVAITGAFDTVGLWIYGNNVSYTHDKSTLPIMAFQFHPERMTYDERFIALLRDALTAF